MNINKQALIDTYREFEGSLGCYDLPSWKELPDLPLYMDQVITLIGKYLGEYTKALGTHTLLTPSMINNYVKQKIVKPPVIHVGSVISVS